MILDKRTEFCDNVLLNTGAAGTYLLGDQIDIVSPGSSLSPAPIGVQDELYLVILASAAITTAGSAGTVSFSLASDDTASIATNGSATVHFTTRAFVTGSTAIPAGTVLACVKLPVGFDYERFVGILQTTGTTALNAGRIDAFLTPDPARWAAYEPPFQL